MKHDIGVVNGKRKDGTKAVQNIEMTVIPEGDIYRLAAKSELTEAEKFEALILGNNFDRTSYKKLINDMDIAKQANPNEKIALIVTELDRLGKNKQLMLKEIRMMKDKGVRLMVLEIPTTLTELPGDSSSIATMIMETINNISQIIIDMSRNIMKI